MGCPPAFGVPALADWQALDACTGKILWKTSLDPATGKLIWATQAGPGGVLGGIEWGTSTDGESIYAAVTNGSHQTYTYTTYDGQKRTTTGGLWTALDAASGKMLWQTAAPEKRFGRVRRS